ncbi:MAG: hypothetical protein JXB14_00055 [Candidatus Altiarchaeota archaeon]|nr:hypothetical protein [Candidatus Altiarchaeota archaeon]
MIGGAITIGGVELEMILLVNIILLVVLLFLIMFILQTWVKIRGLLREREDYDEEVKALTSKITEYNQKMSTLLEEASRVRGDIKKKKITDEMEKIMIKV